MLPNGSICRFLMQCNNHEDGQLKGWENRKKIAHSDLRALSTDSHAHRDGKATLMYYTVDEDEGRAMIWVYGKYKGRRWIIVYIESKL
jgi:hypothetical protein